MALHARLELRQGQGLVITPQLQQAIKLLQLSNVELEEFVETEIEKNPLLQRDERDAAPEAESPDEPVSSGEIASDQVTVCPSIAAPFCATTFTTMGEESDDPAATDCESPLTRVIFPGMIGELASLPLHATAAARQRTVAGIQRVEWDGREVRSAVMAGRGSGRQRWRPTPPPSRGVEPPP